MNENETINVSQHLWTINDAAAYLGVSRRYVERVREKGSFAPAIRLGKAVRFDPEDVRLYAARHREAA